MTDDEKREEAIFLLHYVHLRTWNGRAHRCRVFGCSGLEGEPTDGIDIWVEGSAPFRWHGRGRAVDWVPRRRGPYPSNWRKPW